MISCLHTAGISPSYVNQHLTEMKKNKQVGKKKFTFLIFTSLRHLTILLSITLGQIRSHTEKRTKIRMSTLFKSKVDHPQTFFSVTSRIQPSSIRCVKGLETSEVRVFIQLQSVGLKLNCQAPYRRSDKLSIFLTVLTTAGKTEHVRSEFRLAICLWPQLMNCRGLLEFCLQFNRSQS